MLPVTYLGPPCKQSLFLRYICFFLPRKVSYQLKKAIKEALLTGCNNKVIIVTSAVEPEGTKRLTTHLSEMIRYIFSLHFSASEHQKADWLGIHQKICQLLIPLRTPIPFLGSEEERQHRKQQQIVRQVFVKYDII